MEILHNWRVLVMDRLLDLKVLLNLYPEAVEAVEAVEAAMVAMVAMVAEK
jgi:hypothetical protein